MNVAFKLAPHEWALLRTLLDEALAVPARGRAAWLEALDARRSAGLKPRLRALLANAADEEGDPGTAARLLETLPKVETHQFAPAPGAGAEAPGATVGPYRLLRELGSGGMGSVWLAQRSDLLQGRQVALKLPHGAWKRAGLSERLAREREILATLEHRNIARLYDAGVTPEGQPWLALEYVPGERIDAWCKARQLPVAERLKLFLQVARAVAHAHAHLVVHRDLKPANILVTEGGDAKLLDFGIAKLVQEGVVEETELTREAGRVLTPEYASPEQVLGRPLGTASDVYSLGVLLFELLADVRPYKVDRASRAALEEAITQGDVPRPSVLAPAARRKLLRGDLDTIVLKALKREPGERYATVAALADDVQRHLAHQPVLAQPDSAMYRLRTFARRNRLVVGAGAAVFAATLAGAGVALWQMGVARSEQQRAAQALGFLTQVFREADPSVGRGERPSAADLLKRARERVDAQFAAQPAVRVEVLNTLAESFLGVQDMDSADETSATALREALALHGERHVQTLRARAARVRLHRGRYEPAKWRAEIDALLPALRADPERHAPMLMQAWVDLAELEVGERKLEQADATARAALAQADRLGGAWDAERSALWQSLAASLEFRQQYAAALDAAERAVRHAQAAWADRARHPQEINARFLRGRLMSLTSRPGEGVAELERVFDDAAALWGPESASAAQYLQVLTIARVRAGRLAQAEASAPRALALMLKNYPPESHHVGATLDTLAFVHLQARRTHLAVPLYEQLLAGHLAAPALREQALTARMRRAIMLAWQGRFDVALPELAHVVDEYGRVGRGSLTTPLFTLGQAERLAGRPAVALELQRRSLAAVREGPQAARERLAARAEAGIALQALGRHGEAERELLQALAEWDAMGLAPMPARSDMAQALGQALLAQGHKAQALPHLRQADGYWAQADAGAPSAGEAAYWLAKGLEASGEPAAARAARQRALLALQRSPLPAHRALAKGAPLAPG
ncbi:MAG: protein kinase [Burkholderiales bacterium]|nr:protein kinase [Burkholderiales bacterium]